MKVWSKVSALALALMFVMTLSVSAFAVNLTDGKIGAGGSSAALQSDEAVSIQKDLMFYNPETTTVNAPTITYSYAVSAATAGDVIIDTTGVRVETKAGVLTALKVKGSSDGTASTTATTYSTGTSVSADIAWTTGKQVSATSAGTADTQYLEIDFSDVVFGAAGVYRYVITESATYGTTGVTETTGTHTRYLDVYVKDGSSTDAGAWDVYGFVCCYDDNSSINAKTDDAGNNISNIVKTNGFVTAGNISADTYYTYNVSIKKDLTADSANNAHRFPFNVTLTRTTAANSVLPTIETSDNTKATVPTWSSAGDIGASSSDFDVTVSGSGTSATSNISIANGGDVTIKGIPTGTTVTVSEYNNVLGTTYAVTTANGSTDISTAENKTTGETSSNVTATTTINVAAASNFTGNSAVTFTNTMVLISPTGVTMRYAPYLLTMGAGLAVLPLSIRRKKEQMF